VGFTRNVGYTNLGRRYYEEGPVLHVGTVIYKNY